MVSKSKSGNAGSSNPAMTKRGRFNSNPTACSHPGCQVAAQAKVQSEAYRKAPRKVIVYRSSLGDE